MEKDKQPHTVIVEGPKKSKLKIVFKPEWQPGKLSEAELTVLMDFKDEILQEIEEEEQKILAEEKAQQEQEAKSCK